jgi:hypothetical protein
MPRPPEYDNLVKTGAFAAVQQTPGAVEQYLKNAGEYLDTAKGLDIKRPTPVFTMAYEGFYAVVQAVLEFHGVRTKDSGRNLAITRVAHDLGLDGGEFKLVSDAHNRRNGTTYVSPLPPVTRAEASGLMALLDKYLPRAHALTGIAVPRLPSAPAESGAPGP